MVNMWGPCHLPVATLHDVAKRSAVQAGKQRRKIAAGQARARAQVYHALAEALAGPVPGIQRLMLDATTVAAREFGSPACRDAALSLAGLPMPGVDELQKGYARLTNSPDRRPLPLYESLYRYGHLAGSAMWEVADWYRAAGLEPATGELPDHASMELAFLGHLAEAEAEAWANGNSQLVARLRAEQRRFLKEHVANWLPEVGARLAAGDDPFYVVVGRLLSEFLSEELKGRKHEQQAKVRLPALTQPADCTLCGLCVGSCPLGALGIVETESETALMLDPSRCVGCDRCERICPEGILVLGAGPGAPGRVEAASRTRHRVLRQSPRATCPRCGRPTVSQAELDAVFARLEPNEVTQALLRLCVDCKAWGV